MAVGRVQSPSNKARKTLPWVNEVSDARLPSWKLTGRREAPPMQPWACNTGASDWEARKGDVILAVAGLPVITWPAKQLLRATELSFEDEVRQLSELVPSVGLAEEEMTIPTEGKEGEKEHSQDEYRKEQTWHQSLLPTYTSTNRHLRAGEVSSNSCRHRAWLQQRVINE